VFLMRTTLMNVCRTNETNTHCCKCVSASCTEVKKGIKQDCRLFRNTSRGNQAGLPSLLEHIPWESNSTTISFGTHPVGIKQDSRLFRNTSRGNQTSLPSLPEHPVGIKQDYRLFQNISRGNQTGLPSLPEHIPWESNRTPVSSGTHPVGIKQDSRLFRNTSRGNQTGLPSLPEHFPWESNRTPVSCGTYPVGNVSIHTELGVEKYCNLQHSRSRGSSVSTVSDCGLDDRISIPDRGRGFLL
jgi:hypothetical protein